ncbi:hypothetical protein [Actinokineospora sp.]|uniref:hypothetical protein n=1 Tax=Actinokineospora sp. TaxID=1872133 RepID=UPI004037C515
MTPDDALRALMRKGFRSMPVPGEVLVFTYGWEEGFTDVVQVRAENDVTAVRSSDHDAGVDLFSDDAVVWKAEGDLVEAVADLLALPAPGEPGAPSLVIHAPSRLWTPAGGSPARTLSGPIPFI